METSDWIALAAFAVAAATFLWKFIETYIRWPRVGVVMRRHIVIEVGSIASAEMLGKMTVASASEPPPTDGPATQEATGEPDSEPAARQPQPERTGDTIDLIVVNNGAEAASIANVGIRSRDRSRNINVQSLRDDGYAEIKGPDLPARVEAHGALVWVIPPEKVVSFPRGTPMVGYAHRYKTIHKWTYRTATFVREHKIWKFLFDRLFVRRLLTRWTMPFVVHETVAKSINN